MTTDEIMALALAERLEAASYALPGGWDQEDNPRPRNVCTEAADFLRGIATLQSKVANQSDAVANPDALKERA